MGQFSTRPEEPTEWAGLPSEPERTRTEAESLPDPVASAGSLGFLDTSIASVVIPVAPVAPVDEKAATEADPGA